MVMTEPTNDPATAFEVALTGRVCTVERREADWWIDFPAHAGIAVGCHWRLVSPDSIMVTDEDDGQIFGLPRPVDAAARANDLLARATVTSVRIDRLTADLCVFFSNGFRLDILNNSCGYEGWQAYLDGRTGLPSFIGMGGGVLASF